MKWSVSKIAVALGMVAMLALAAVILQPEFPSAGEKTTRLLCKLNLQKIGWALEDYRNRHGGRFPAPFTRDSKTGQIYSWRVAILAEVGNPALYDKYDFARPWDSDANAVVAHTAVAEYRCPSRFVPGQTTDYLMVVPDDGDLVNPCEDGGPRRIVIIEVKGSQIPWAEPRDVRLSELSLKLNDPSRPSIGSDHPGGAHVLYCDGTVEFIKDTISPAELARLLGKSSEVEGLKPAK